MNKLFDEIKEKRSILLLGFGKEGKSTYRWISNHLSDIGIGIADRDPGVEEEFRKEFPGQKAIFHLGQHYLEAVENYPLTIKSPGVALPEGWSPGIKSRVTSQTDLVLKNYHRQVIGVTGTKGKSTTSSLIHHLIVGSGRDAVLVGNIGLPPFDHLEKVSDSTIIVFELSSNMLEDISNAPYIAVLLNLYPEHLDRYATLKDYYDAKMNILACQLEDDVFIYNEDIPEIGRRITEFALGRNYLSFSSGIPLQNGAYLDGEDILLSENGIVRHFIRITDQFLLRGKHNRMNMMATLLAARAAGIEDEAIRQGLATFKGLEHRLEYVGRYSDIEFYNDSIATIPEAAMAAVKSLPDTDTMILGGYDRGLDYTGLTDFLASSGVRNFIFLGKAGKRMLELFRMKGKEGINLFEAGDLGEAFRIIPEVTRPGKICLLSPAAASYDIFKNFEERGTVFKKLARSL
jgi:UDP-N-acetylmuramoyl-L-alanine---L-glutamate ligase